MWLLEVTAASTLETSSSVSSSRLTKRLVPEPIPRLTPLKLSKKLWLFGAISLLLVGSLPRTSTPMMVFGSSWKQSWPWKLLPSFWWSRFLVLPRTNDAPNRVRASQQCADLFQAIAIRNDCSRCLVGISYLGRCPVQVYNLYPEIQRQCPSCKCKLRVE